MLFYYRCHVFRACNVTNLQGVRFQKQVVILEAVCLWNSKQSVSYFSLFHTKF